VAEYRRTSRRRNSKFPTSNNTRLAQTSRGNDISALRSSFLKRDVVTKLNKNTHTHTHTRSTKTTVCHLCSTLIFTVAANKPTELRIRNYLQIKHVWSFTYIYKLCIKHFIFEDGSSPLC